MKSTSMILLPAMFLAAFTLRIYGQGIVIRHTGATDPVTEGFYLNLAVGSWVGPVVGDFGRDSWSVLSGGFPASYGQSLTAQQQTDITGRDWALSASLRIVQGPNIWLAFYTDSAQFSVGLSSQSDGDPIVTSRSSLSPVFALEGGGPGYHDYQLAYSAATGQATLWVDGVERVTDIGGISGFSGWSVFWGAAQGSPSEANWNSVTFEIIPEPSTMALLGCGGVLLAGQWLLRFRTRK